MFVCRQIELVKYIMNYDNFSLRSQQKCPKPLDNKLYYNEYTKKGQKEPCGYYRFNVY